MTGAEIINNDLNSESKFEIRVSDLKTGIYLYRVTTGNSQAASGKLIVE